jgi:V/A-type H+-transporting ATPase subunit A
MSRAVIRSISGPVLRATASGPFKLREAVEVGPQALLGEVVRLSGEEIVVQVYEDTTGLRPARTSWAKACRSRCGWGRVSSATSSTACCVRSRQRGSAFVAPGMRSAAAATFGFVPRVRRGSVSSPRRRLR